LGDFDRAEVQFDTALASNQKSIAALLGKACVLYNRNKFPEALDCYRNILNLNPSDASANVRLGIGLCHYRLGRTELARKSFERTLELDPSNVQALVAMAILDMNTGDRQKIHDAMVNGFKKAATIDPRNPTVLNYFAKYFIYGKRDLKKVQSLANDAFMNTLVSEIKAESSYYRALAYHEEFNFDLAYKFYAQAVALWSDFPLARYGLGQMHIHRGDIDAAIAQFEIVLKSDTNNVEVHKVLGSLYGQKGKLAKALEHLRKANELDQSKDYENLIEISQYEQNPQLALDALRKAQIIMEDKKIAIPHEFWNNMGALNHKAGRVKEAEEFYMKSLGMCNGGGATLENFSDEHLSIVFNIARLFEDTKRVAQAKDLYLKLVKMHPAHVEVYMRLAMIEYLHFNNIEKAIEYCVIMSHIKPKDPVPHALVGYFYLLNDQQKEAQSKLEYTFGVLDRTHTFTLLALASIFFNGIRPNEMNPERIDKHLLYTQQYLEKAIKSDKSNEFAALNMGALIAEMGYLEEAKDIFLRVRDLNPDIQETNINLAHIYLCQQQYDMAIKSYERVLSKAPAAALQQQNITKQYKVLLFLARTYFDCNKLEESEDALLKAIALAPTKNVLTHDLAIVQFEQCTRFLKDKMKTLEGAKKALTAITKAHVNFELVAQQKSKEDLQYKAKMFDSKCEQCKTMVNEVLQRQEEKAKQEQAEKEERIKHMAEKLRARQQQEEDARKAKELAAEKEREIQEKLLQEREELLSKWESQQPPASSKKSKKKGGRDDNDDNMATEASGDASGSAASDTPKKKRPRKKKADSNEGDEPSSPSSSKKRASGSGSSKKKGIANKKAKRLVKNAEDDDDEENNNAGGTEEDEDKMASDEDEGVSQPLATEEGENEVTFDDDNTASAEASNKDNDKGDDNDEAEAELEGSKVDDEGEAEATIDDEAPDAKRAKLD